MGKKTLTDYPLEQQAQIIADYWLLVHYGFNEWSDNRIPGGLITCKGDVDELQLHNQYNFTLAKFHAMR